VKKPTDISGNKILCVEGNDEVIFFNELITYLQIRGIQVIECGGKELMRDGLVAICKLNAFRNVDSMGIIRDADTDPSATFQSIQGALRNVNHEVPDLNLEIPKKPSQIVGSKPKITIYLMPRLNTPGMLEDLCLASVAGTPTMECVEDMFKCVEKHSLPIPKNESKARVQAYLSTQEEPDKRLGITAQKGYWRFDNPAFNEISVFLKNLFG
jgi:hypothetical protein